jgi:tRNA threonylcarbamoyladenosine biosynthesis protein TsaB
MATAKGLCYVLKIPLIVENTLKVMAYAAHKELQLSQPKTSTLKYLLVPMIDARRMEVFTAVYDGELKEIMPPTALVLSDASFAGINAGKQLVCFGNGSSKFQPMASSAKFSLRPWNMMRGHWVIYLIKNTSTGSLPIWPTRSHFT